MQPAYSKDVRCLLTNAHLAARRFRHRHIHTEYLLLGLLQERNSATRLLAQLGCNPEELRRLCESKCERGEHRPREDKTMADIQRWTSHVQSIMVTAGEEMRHQGHEALDAHHILLALLLEDSGIGGEVLRMAGVSAEGVRAIMDIGMNDEDIADTYAPAIKIEPTLPRLSFRKIWSRA